MIITNKAARKRNSSSRRNECNHLLTSFKSIIGKDDINTINTITIKPECMISLFLFFSRTLHAHIDDIRPIPTLNSSIFNKCVTPDPYAPIKQGMVPDSSQCGEARAKVIPEESLRGRRWGRSCEHRGRSCEHLLCPLVDIIHNTTILIHLDPIFKASRPCNQSSSAVKMDQTHWSVFINH